MSGVHERRLTAVGRVSSWIVRHPLRFQALGFAGVVAFLAVSTVTQPVWRIMLQVVGSLFCLWFGAMAGLILARCRGRRQMGVQVK